MVEVLFINWKSAVLPYRHGSDIAGRLAITPAVQRLSHPSWRYVEPLRQQKARAFLCPHSLRFRFFHCNSVLIFSYFYTPVPKWNSATKIVKFYELSSVFRKIF